MMITHLVGIIVAIAFVVFCTLLPFLPGRHDGLAITLSMMAQVAGIVSWVFVPIGMLWLVVEQRRAQRRYVFSLLALIASSFVAIAVGLVAIVQSGFVLGSASLALWVYVAYRAWLRIRQARRTTPERSSTLPFYLVAVPTGVVLLQFALVERAVEFSRNRAILNSAPLIAAIEQHRATHGRYPASLLSVWPDYWPNVIGIKEYKYEPNGDAYNLLFEQFAAQFGVREFVMYNPRDEHVMTSHAIDLLELTPEQLALEHTRGHNALHNSPHPHWKYFWFD